MSNDHRFLVVGCGSIGKRHMGNLLALGVSTVIGMDPRADRREEAESSLGVATVSSLEEAWGHQPDVAVIATPSSLHVPLALEAARQGCHLFIEKPLSNRMEGVDEFLDVVSEQDLTALVGCNLRLHHGPATVKRLLDEGAIGHVVSAQLDSGQYLPDWHPWEDYRDMYSAKSSQGGGVVLDGIHEIDYARWLFGEVDGVFAQGGKLSSLEIDTEDTVDILMNMVDGTNVSIHMDYLQRDYSRTCKVVGEEGTIVWDVKNKGVRMYSANTGEWSDFPDPVGYNVNQMYVEEMQHFLACLDGKERPALDASDAKRVLEIALAIKASMESGEKKYVS
jgi:predicted dehydrogenase